MNNVFLYLSFLLLSFLLLIQYAKWIFIFLLFPFQVAYNRALKGKLRPGEKFLVRPYQIWEKLCKNGWERYMLYQVGLIPSCRLRKNIYKALGAEIEEKVVFHFRTEIRGIVDLKIGKGSIIGDNTLLDARRGLILGENVNISSNVSIYSWKHDHRDPYFGCDVDVQPIRIGDRAWIGSNVIILQGVTVGEGAVCCAGCVVTKDVEPYAVVAGIPAKKVNERPTDLRYEFDGSSCRFY